VELESEQQEADSPSVIDPPKKSVQVEESLLNIDQFNPDLPEKEIKYWYNLSSAL